jgi:hypothetical protein
MADSQNLSLDQLAAIAFPDSNSGSNSASSSSSTASPSSFMAPTDAINQIESSGASDAASVPNAASSAQGSMQVLAGTRSSPGFGVTPSNGTPQDTAREGRDYYNAMAGRYNDPTTAALAYSWGPGNTDKWLQNGADPSKLPQTQQDYLNKFSKLTGVSATPSQASLDQLAAIAFPSNASTANAPAQAPQAQQGTGSFLGDVGQGFSNTLTGAANAVMHPIDTATNIYNGVKGNLSQAYQNPSAYLKGMGASLVNNLENGIAAQTNNETPFASQQQQQALQQDAASRNITAGTANPQAFNAGQSAGNFAQNAGLAVAAPEALGVPGLAGKAILGAGVQTGASALQNGATGGQALGQALGGSLTAVPVAGAGSVVGKAIGSAAGKVADVTSPEVAAAKQAVQGAVQANGFTPNDLTVAQKLAQRVDQTAPVTGQSVDDVANELTAKAQNPVPSYQPTAAEATVNPVIQSVQRGLENQSMEGLDTRIEQNGDANTAHLQNQAAGDSTITDLQNQVGNTPMQNLADQWNSIAGTPAQSANLERPMYQQVFDQASPIPVDGDLQKILNTPAGKIATANTEKFRANSLNDTPLINDGAIQPQDLNQVKIEMDNLISRMSNPADTEANALKFQKNAIIGLRNRLDGILDINVPGFADANKVYQQGTEAMQASRFLTDPNMVDAFGNVNLNRLKALNDSITAGQANNDPFDPAKLVSPAKVNQLQQMQKDLTALKQAKGTVGTGVNGQLSVNSAANPAAFNQYSDYLRGQGQGSTADAMQQLAQHQNYQNVLNKIDARQSQGPAWNDVAKINQQDGLYTPEQTAALQDVRQNLINRDAYQYKNIKGSPTANKNADIQNVNELTGKTGIGKYISTPEGERVLRTGGDAALGAAHLGGPLTALAGWGLDKTIGKVVNKFGASAQQANTQALEGLMLNPERLAQALKVGKQMNDLQASRAATASSFSKLIGQTTRGGLLGGTSGPSTPQP